jgi:hypothetical protein
MLFWAVIFKIHNPKGMANKAKMTDGITSKEKACPLQKKKSTE